MEDNSLFLDEALGWDRVAPLDIRREDRETQLPFAAGADEPGCLEVVGCTQSALEEVPARADQELSERAHVTV